MTLWHHKDDPKYYLYIYIYTVFLYFCYGLFGSVTHHTQKQYSSPLKYSAWFQQWPYNLSFSSAADTVELLHSCESCACHLQIFSIPPTFHSSIYSWEIVQHQCPHKLLFFLLCFCFQYSLSKCSRTLNFDQWIEFFCKGIWSHRSHAFMTE